MLCSRQPSGSTSVGSGRCMGTTYRVFCPRPVPVRASMSASRTPISPPIIEKLIDGKTRAVFCEIVGNPAATSVHRGARTRGARPRFRPSSTTRRTPILLAADRVRATSLSFAHQVFMGGHGHDARRNHPSTAGSSLSRARRTVPMFQPTRTPPIPGWLHRAFQGGRDISRCRSFYQRPRGPCCRPHRLSPAGRASRRGRCGSNERMS